MMMKKMFVLLLALSMTCVFTACGSTTVGTAISMADHAANTGKESEASESDRSAQQPETVVIQAMNANKETIEVEVPYDPQRIAVLDMPALDILDALNLGDRVAGSAAVSIDYLADYNPEDSQGDVMNLGTIKTADLEKVAACEPDLIFIGGRLSAVYADLEAIAPVVCLGVDYEKGIVESTRANAETIASIFGKEAEVEELFGSFQPRIDALHEVLNGKNVLLGMYNANALSLMDTESQLNMIAREFGANNLGETVGEGEKATHGEEASWETILTLNPEYLFILDRSTATNAAEEGLKGVREVVENELIQELDVYKNGRILYLIEHADVWYTSTGGVQALDTMLTDLEGMLLQEG